MFQIPFLISQTSSDSNFYHYPRLAQIRDLGNETRLHENQGASHVMTLLGSQNKRLILPSFVLAMLVLLITGIAAYRQGKRNVAAEQWVRHSYEVLAEAFGLPLAATPAEAAGS